MGIYFLLFVIIVHLNQAILTEQDVCIIPKNIYTKQFHNDYFCEKPFCQGNLNFKCGLNHCTKNMNKCLKAFMNNQINFVRPVKMFKIWNATGICLNGKGCNLHKIVPMRSGTYHRISKKIDCPCKNQFKVPCGNQYCALSKAYCDEFYSKMDKNEKFLIKKCFNDNQVIKLF